jgi:predicted Ser/Thr protein kinase
MTRCGDCHAEVAEGNKYCPQCGSRVAPSSHPPLTFATPRGFPPRVKPPDFHQSTIHLGSPVPSEADDKPLQMPPDSTPTPLPNTGKASDVAFLPSKSPAPRLPPGKVILDRYEIVSLLGEGAMGEVYLADDRRLGERVALKFVASGASANETWRKGLLEEARLARKITHPNVCRVFDVGDTEGQPFISMEYVNGESFSSLLKRIGRLPSDKALSVAHQMCAGLACAHERGVLHRDLKPANFMLDGDGEVKIMDFGLAGTRAELQADTRRAGTPAYMSPEQLRGQGITEQSDIYSLGLVLYELFTGKPVYRPQTLQQLEELHDQPVRPPSEIVPTLDPEIDRAVMWCLARDPTERPQSVRALVMTLPGGDALDAALLAGHVPTPRLVAAAGESGLIKRSTAAALAIAMAAILAIGLFMGEHTSMLRRVPLTRSPEVLADNARTMIERFGFATENRHEAYAFDLYEEYLDLIRAEPEGADRWGRLALSRPSPIDFWFRSGPRPLTSLSIGQRVDYYDPPFDQAGMINIRLDPRGRLREFNYRAPQEKTEFVDPQQHPKPLLTAEGTPDWNPLLEAAGLDQHHLRPIMPQRVPTVFADTRAAWDGVYPESPGEPIRVEAAFHDGRPVAFRIVELRWLPASMAQPRSWTQSELAGIKINRLMELSALVAAVLMAWRNLRARRGDKPGASRLAIGIFTLSLLGNLFLAAHTTSLEHELRVLADAVRLAISDGLWFWVVYLAVEPYVRRIWPHTLIDWSRLASDHWQDPLVGRSFAVGTLAGLCGVALAYAHRTAGPLLGFPASMPWIDSDRGVIVLHGGLDLVGTLLSIIPFGAKFAASFLLALVLIKFLVPSRILAATIYAALQTVVWYLMRGDSPLSWVFMAAMSTICAIVLVRYGVLALTVAVATFTAMTSLAPSLDWGRWYAGHSAFTVLIVALTFAAGLTAATTGNTRRLRAGTQIVPSAIP